MENDFQSEKIEIDKIFTPYFLDHKIKLSCILYSLNLIKILTVENQSNINIYNQFFFNYYYLFCINLPGN